MSRDLNRWTGIGRLGKDPELKYFSSGDAYCNVSIACGETWKDKATGDKKERTEWVNLAINGKLAEIVAEYAKKGSRLYVEGKLTTRKWQKDGKDQYTTEVRIDGINGAVQLLDGKQDGAAQAPRTAQAAAADEDDDSVPF